MEQKVKKIFSKQQEILFIGSNFCKYDYRLSAPNSSILIIQNIFTIRKLFKEITKNHYLIYKPHESTIGSKI